MGHKRWIIPDPVHPHAGGEYFLCSLPVDLHPGSPPRRWGIPRDGDTYTQVDRFTPTQVGNTADDEVTIGSITVHPHAGGEYASWMRTSPTSTGSPPRRWGIRVWVASFRHSGRFTPTQVGNTQGLPPRRLYHPVHPHAGGEYRLLRCPVIIPIGSPPRRWGIRL